MIPDPADRIRSVRDEIARQNAKLPRVDHDGRPIVAEVDDDDDHDVPPAA